MYTGHPLTYVILVMTLLLAIGWLVLITLPMGWMRKITSLIIFDAGLYEATIEVAPFTKLAALAAKKVLKQDALAKGMKELWVGGRYGVYSLMYLSSIWCQPGLLNVFQYCEGFSGMYHGGLIMLFTAGFGILSLVMGAAFHYYYWFVQARAKWRHWMMRCLITGPLFFMCGFFAYTAFTLSVVSIDPVDVPGMNYGYIAAAFLTILNWLPAMIHYCCLDQHPEEELIEEQIFQRKMQQEEMMYAQFGSQLGQGGAPGRPTQSYDSYGSTSFQSQSPPAPRGTAGLGGSQYGSTYSVAGGATTSYTSTPMPPPPAMQGGGGAPSNSDTAGMLPMHGAGSIPPLQARTLGQL